MEKQCLVDLEQLFLATLSPNLTSFNLTLIIPFLMIYKNEVLIRTSFKSVI